MVKLACQSLTFFILITYREHFVFLVPLTDFYNCTFVFGCKSLIHTVFHNVLESMECMAIVCKWIKIVKTSDFRIISFQNFQIVIINEICTVFRFISFLAIMHFNLQCIIVKKLLPNHFGRHFQINLIVIRSCQFASLISLGLCGFTDINFITEELSRFSSVCDKGFIFR